MACGCKGHGPDPNCECKDLPKRECGCPEGDICCMDCGCACHEPAEFVRHCEDAARFGGEVAKQRIDAALEKLGEAPYHDKNLLVSEVWNQVIREQSARYMPGEEVDVHNLLKQARGVSMSEAIWARYPKLKRKFGTYKVFMAYAAGMP